VPRRSQKRRWKPDQKAGGSENPIGGTSYSPTDGSFTFNDFVALRAFAFLAIVASLALGLDFEVRDRNR
jgi:hypothetical protein